MTDKPINGVPDHRPGIMGIHASRAVERLKTGKPGDSINREQMADIISRPCHATSPGYGNVQSAINRVEIDHGIVWRWDRGAQAWVCLTHSQKVGVLKDSVRTARKRVSRGLRVANTVDMRELTDEQKQECGLMIATAGVMRLCGGSGFAKKLQAIEKPREPDTSKLLALMAGSQ